jgi:hypothetical protein
MASSGLQGTQPDQAEAGSPHVVIPEVASKAGPPADYPHGPPEPELMTTGTRSLDEMQTFDPGWASMFGPPGHVPVMESPPRVRRRSELPTE